MATSTITGTKSRFLRITSYAVVGFVILFLFCTGLLEAFVKFAWILTTGWFLFLWRTSEKMDFRFSSVASFFGGLIVLIFLVHRTAKWLTPRKLPGEAGATNPSLLFEWRFRTTCVAVLVFLCSCVAGIFLVGITHEMAWMASSKEPLVLNQIPRRPYRTQSKNHLKQLGLALHNFHDDQRAYPESRTFDAIGQVRHGWVTPLLPFLDSSPVYNRIRLDLAWSADENREPFETRIPTLIIPSSRQRHDEGGYAPNHYAGNHLVLQPGHRRPMNEITDGTSNTFLAGEVNSNFEPWGKPGNCRDPQLGINKSSHGFGSPFQGGANFLFADGTVRFLSNDVDPKILKAIATPDGGEPLDPF